MLGICVFAFASEREEIVSLRSSRAYKGWRIAVMVFGAFGLPCRKTGMKSESVRLDNRKRLACGRMICGFCAGRHISKIGDGGVQYEGWRRPQLTIQAGFVSEMSSNQVKLLSRDGAIKETYVYALYRCRVPD